jgi:hypothetical protein
MNTPVAGIAERYAVCHVKPKLGVIPIRLDVVRVEFNFFGSTVLASRHVPADNRVYPLMMWASAILTSGVFSVVWMGFSAVSETTLVSASLRAKLSLSERRYVAAVAKQLAAVLAGFRPFAPAPPWMPFANECRFPPFALTLVRAKLRGLLSIGKYLKLALTHYALDCSHGAPLAPFYYTKGPKFQSGWGYKWHPWGLHDYQSLGESETFPKERS